MKLSTLILLVGGARLLVDMRARQEAEEFTEDAGFFGSIAGPIGEAVIDARAQQLRDVLDLTLLVLIVVAVS